MKMSILRLVSALFLLTCFSCGKIQDQDPVVDIPITFQLVMEEKLQPGFRPFVFHLKSTEILDCANYLIDYELNQGDRTIDLTLKDFSLAAPCVPEPGVAKADISLGALDPGYYDLVISLRGIVYNEGMLVVLPESFSVYLESLDGISFPAGYTLLRIPNHSIWGGVYVLNDSLSYLADEFIAELAMVAAPFELIPGYYGPFIIHPDNTATLLNTDEPGAGQTFVLRYGGSRNGLINLVEEYRVLGGGGLAIHLFDVDGYQY